MNKENNSGAAGESDEISSLKAAFDAAVSLAGETIEARNAEIADLRAQLAATTQNLQTAVQEAWNARAQLAQVQANSDDISAHLSRMTKIASEQRAQLARQQAPVGESIDTPEFHKLLHDYIDVWRDTARPVEHCEAAWDNLIAHIDAQLARQRQGTQHEASAEGTCKEADGCPTEMAVLKRFWREHHTTPAPQAQGEPVASDMQTYWLVELRPAFPDHPSFPATYYAGWMNGPLDAAKTLDVHASPKFTSKEAAQQVAQNLGHTLSCVWEAVEHGFYLAPAAQADEGGASSEALVRNAARYRWLRHADLDALAEANWGKDGEVYEGEAFDKAIDEAMQNAALKRTIAATDASKPCVREVQAAGWVTLPTCERCGNSKNCDRTTAADNQKG